MGKSSSKAPAAPDPVATAQAQSQYNAETARLTAQLNRVNQYGPQGSVTYSNDGLQKYNTWAAAKTAARDADPELQAQRAAMGAKWTEQNNAAWEKQLQAENPYAAERDNWTQTTTLSPEQQQLYNLATQAQTTYGRAANTLLQNASSAISTPVNMDGLPGLSGAPQAGQLRTGYDSGGAIQRGVADAGAIQRGVAATDHGVQYGAADTGRQLRTFADVGPVQRRMGSAADYAQDRNAVEAALYARLNPQLDREKAALQTQLANQGLVPGTQAYTAAMDDYNRGANDARLAVTAQGLQEQQGLYGMASNRFSQENAAQQQAYGQALGRAQFYNQGQSEDTNQALQRTALWNQAQAQQYGQNANNAQFTNAAQAQQYGQNLNTAQFTNQAQAQQYGQNAQNAAFWNQSTQGQYNMDLAGAQLSNAARQQGLQERLTLQQAPINQASALLSGSQVSMPSFQSAPSVQVSPTDYVGASNNSFNAQMQAYGAQQQANASALGGLYGLGGSFLGSSTGGNAMSWLGSNALSAGSSLLAALSDRRAKTDIEEVGRLHNGLPVYVFRYLGDPTPQLGLMAQDVAQVRPEAVEERPDGLLAVRYALAVR